MSSNSIEIFLTSRFKKAPKAKNKHIFLTTLNDWDLEELIHQVGSETWTACLIQICSNESETGLLQGEWIKAIWNKARNEIPSLMGHRLGWSTLLFLVPTTNIELVRQHFIIILQSLVYPNLESRCVLTMFEGEIQTKLMIIDLMTMDADKWHQHGRKPTPIQG